MRTYDFGSLTEADLRARRSSKWTKYPADVLPAFVAEMDLAVCDEIRQAVLDAVDRHDFGYPPMPHDVGFGEAVAAWQARSHGWTVDPSLVLMASDVVRGMEQVVLSLTQPGDGVIITPPIYPPFRTVASTADRVPVTVPMLRSGSSWRLDLDGIDRAFAHGARVLSLCHPHNPLGALLGVDEIEAVGEMAERYGAWITSDEIHAPLVHPSRDGSASFVPVASVPAAAARTITITSTSKAFNTAGLKCAAIIGPSAEVGLLLPTVAKARGGTGLLGVLTMLAAMEHGEPWRQQVMAHLTSQRDHLVDRLRAELPEVEVVSPDATYLVWVDGARLGLPEEAATWLLREARVAFSAGSDFSPDHPHCWRWNVGTTRALLDEAIDRVVAALSRR